MERLRLDNNFVSSRDVIAVQLLVRIFHLLGPTQLAVAVIDVVESHLVSWETEKFLETEFEISDISRIKFRISNKWSLFSLMKTHL